MLERPAIGDDHLAACLNDAFGLTPVELDFLPLGADPNTAVYRAAGGGAAYFVKLRSGNFDESAVAVPRYLSDQGIREIIAPLRSNTGQLWSELGGYRLLLYPFVESRDAYEVEWTAALWRGFGAALRRIHDAELPPALGRLVRRETFSSRWRERLADFLDQTAATEFDEPAAAAMAALLNHRRQEIRELIDHAARLAARLAERPRPFGLCHSDLHAGNIVLDGDGQLFIVDWDQPILAPRERDLMYPGGAQGFRGHEPADEELLFYDGYGPVDVDWTAVAYYRCERVVEDLAVFAEQLLLSDEGGEDRPQAVRYARSNFEPGGTIERAYAALARETAHGE